MPKLDVVAKLEVGNSFDSGRVLAQVLAEVMPAGFHIDGACAPVEDAYDLLRRLAHAKAPHQSILGSGSRRCSDE